MVERCPTFRTRQLVQADWPISGANEERPTFTTFPFLFFNARLSSQTLPPSFAESATARLLAVALMCSPPDLPPPSTKKKEAAVQVNISATANGPNSRKLVKLSERNTFKTTERGQKMT